MIHDEKTTEIEIPPKTNVTPFRRRATDKQPVGSSQPDLSSRRAPIAGKATVESLPAPELPAWLTGLDVTNPWLIRLFAVAVIVALSLLVI